MRLWIALALVLLAGCAPLPPAQERPRLAVLLVVDGLPQWQATAYRDQLAPGGFARFLERGAWFSDAHHGHAVTATAPGHAAMLTGAYPQRTGIIGNEWRDRLTGEVVDNSADAAYGILDAGRPPRPLDGTSPRRLRVQTVGDVLRGADARSRVIGIAGKERGAILTAGHKGTAYMYQQDTGRFASSTYYMAEHPAWVRDFNAARPADRWFRGEWKPLLPEAAYARSIPDAQPWFGTSPPGLPMTLGAASDAGPGPAYYAQLMGTPFVDELTLAFARAAIAAEQLGRDDAPDILTISLSGHDYVNHRYSAESRISHDHFLRVDRMLDGFFAHLDATVGAANYLAVLTSDHGFTPALEVSRARGHAAGRQSSSQLLAAVNAELDKRFGAPKLVAFTSSSALVLDRKTIAAQGLEFDTVADAARAALLALPSVEAAYTRRELLAGSRAGAPHFDAMRRSWHPEVSGDVQYAYKPYWLPTSGSGNTTSHGSPHAYDTHVPLMLYGPRWVRPGRLDMRVEVVDIAPTLARLLGVPPPATAEGRLLPLR